VKNPDLPDIWRDADIIAAGFASAVAILLLGLLLSVPFAGAQTVPFTGRVDSYTDGSIGTYSLGWGDMASYHGAEYATVKWTPDEDGIFCGFETKTHGDADIDVTMSGSGIANVTWSDHVQAVGDDVEGFYLWPEECFAYASGTTYSFNFSNSGGVSDLTRMYAASATPTAYVQLQYNDGLGWSVKDGHPYFAIVGTSNTSTMEWYETNITGIVPTDVDPDWWGGWKALRDDITTNKVPFGYVGQILDVWESLGDGTSTEWNVTVFGNTIPLMSATDTETAVGTSNFAMVYQFIEWLMWFSFVWFVANRAMDMHI